MSNSSGKIDLYCLFLMKETEFFCTKQNAEGTVFASDICGGIYQLQILGEDS